MTNRQQYCQKIKQLIELDFEPDCSKKETKEALIELKKLKFEKDFKTDEELEAEEETKRAQAAAWRDFFQSLINGDTNDE